MFSIADRDSFNVQTSLRMKNCHKMTAPGT